MEKKRNNKNKDYIKFTNHFLGNDKVCFEEEFDKTKRFESK